MIAAVGTTLKAGEVDFQGDWRRLLPIRLSDELVLVELGTLVSDRSGWRSGRYIYPAGFISERLEISVVNPQEKAWYQSCVIDTGKDAPLFRVQVRDHPEIHFDGLTPSRCWWDVKKAILARGKALALEDIKRDVYQSHSMCSGPKMFGFTNTIVARLIRSLPAADDSSPNE
jgi:chromodomain-helicase-DNA-binding protein 7